eukprot:736696_1
MGNKTSLSTNNQSLSTDQLKTFQNLINMGYNETIAMDAIHKYPKDFNKCIDYIEKQNNNNITTTTSNPKTITRITSNTKTSNKMEPFDMNNTTYIDRINKILSIKENSNNNNNNNKFDIFDIICNLYSLNNN